MAIQDIDRLFLSRMGYRDEKLVHIDYDWHQGNRYHSYTTKLIQAKIGEWQFLRL